LTDDASNKLTEASGSKESIVRYEIED